MVNNREEFNKLATLGKANPRCSHITRRVPELPFFFFAELELRSVTLRVSFYPQHNTTIKAESRHHGLDGARPHACRQYKKTASQTIMTASVDIDPGNDDEVVMVLNPLHGKALPGRVSHRFHTKRPIYLDVAKIPPCI